MVTPRSFVGEVLAAVSMERSVPIDAQLDDACARSRPRCDFRARAADTLRVCARSGARHRRRGGSVDGLTVHRDAVHGAVIEDAQLTLRRLHDHGVPP